MKSLVFKLFPFLCKFEFRSPLKRYGWGYDTPKGIMYGSKLYIMFPIRIRTDMEYRMLKAWYNPSLEAVQSAKEIDRQKVVYKDVYQKTL